MRRCGFTRRILPNAKVDENTEERSRQGEELLSGVGLLMADRSWRASVRLRKRSEATNAATAMRAQRIIGSTLN